MATRRGVGGGLFLGPPIQTLTLLQVIEAVEGPLELTACCCDEPACPNWPGCAAAPVMRRAQERLRRALDVSLLELLEPDQARSSRASRTLLRMPVTKGTSSLV